MSFILDALRKSEHARQRHGGPVLAEVPIRRRSEGRPRWVGIVIALLAINAVVLGVVLSRNRVPAPAPVAVPAPAPLPASDAPSIPQAPAPSSAASPPPAPAPTQTPSMTRAPMRSLAEEAAGSGATDTPPAPAGAARVPDRSPIVRAVEPTSAAAGAGEDLPVINELSGDRAANIPAMHLDIHVYSTNPAERFVFINLRKYVEGEALSEGPLVERITADGVILNQRGFRFVLPRQ